jgi:hypothetical protein
MPNQGSRPGKSGRCLTVNIEREIEHQGHQPPENVQELDGVAKNHVQQWKHG